MSTKYTTSNISEREKTTSRKRLHVRNHPLPFLTIIFFIPRVVQPSTCLQCVLSIKCSVLVMCPQVSQVSRSVLVQYTIYICQVLQVLQCVNVTVVVIMLSRLNQGTCCFVCSQAPGKDLGHMAEMWTTRPNLGNTEEMQVT